jgi:O-antigen/teichoic acid export membrane protein
LFLSVSGVLLAMGAALWLVIAALGDGIWVAVLGEQWESAGEYAVAIAPRAAVLMVVSPISRTVLVFGGQRIKLCFNMFNVAVVLLAFEAAKRFGWSALNAITGISLAQAGAGLVYLILLLIITKRGSQRGSPLETN